MSGTANHSASGRWTLGVAILASTVLVDSRVVCGKVLLNGGFPPRLPFMPAAIAMLPLVCLESGSLCEALFRALQSSKQVAVIGLAQAAAVMSLLPMAAHSVSAATAAILLYHQSALGGAL